MCLFWFVLGLNFSRRCGVECGVKSLVVSRGTCSWVVQGSESREVWVDRCALNCFTQRDATRHKWWSPAPPSPPKNKKSLVLGLYLVYPHPTPTLILPPALLPVSIRGVQDYIPELVGLSKANLEKDDESMLSSGRVLLKVTLWFGLAG